MTLLCFCPLLLPLFHTCTVPSLCCPLLISSCFSLVPFFISVCPSKLIIFCWQFLYFHLSLFVQSYFSFTSHFCLFSLYLLSISPYTAATVRSISDLPGLGFHGDGPSEVVAKALWWPTLFLIADSPVTADGRQLYRHSDCIDLVKGRLDSPFAYHLSTFASASKVR